MSCVAHVYMCLRVCVCACLCVHTFVLVCVRTCVCMNNEIAPFLGVFLSHYECISYMHGHFYDFSSYGTILLF